jgi:exosortase
MIFPEESKERAGTVALALTAGFFVVLLFWPYWHLEGSPSLAVWTWRACNFWNGFGHARFVPLFVAVMLWRWWDGGRNEKKEPSYWGLAWLLPAFFVVWAAVRIDQPRLALLTLPFLSMGFACYWLGGRMAKHLGPTAFFLWFLIPVPGLASLLWFDMRPYEMKTAVTLAGWLGTEAMIQGGSLVEVGGIQLRFAGGSDSGEDLVATLMIGAAVAVLCRATAMRRWILFFLSLPLFFVLRVLRSVTLLTLDSRNYCEQAEWFYFHGRGALQLLLTFGILLGIAWWMTPLCPLRRKALE